MLLFTASPWVRAAETTLTPTDDAYLQNGKAYDNQTLRIRPDFRTTYLRFDPATVSGAVSDAHLILTQTTDEGHGTIEVYLGTHANWSEGTLESNTPAKDTLLDSLIRAPSFSAAATRIPSTSPVLLLTRSLRSYWRCLRPIAMRGFPQQKGRRSPSLP